MKRNRKEGYYLPFFFLLSFLLFFLQGVTRVKDKRRSQSIKSAAGIKKGDKKRKRGRRRGVLGGVGKVTHNDFFLLIFFFFFFFSRSS